MDNNSIARKSIITCITLVFLGVIALTSDSIANVAAEKNSWLEAIQQGRKTFAAKEDDIEIVSGNWYTTGPLSSSKLKKVLFPEKEVNLHAQRKGKMLWTEKPNYEDGIINQLNKVDAAATYLYRTITVNKKTSVGIDLGSDDGMAVWLNGKLLLTRDIARGCTKNQDYIKLPLEKGENHLLMKIYNISGDHLFYYSLQNPSAALNIYNQVAKEYPTQNRWLATDLESNQPLLISSKNPKKIETQILNSVLENLGQYNIKLQNQIKSALKSNNNSEVNLKSYYDACVFRDNLEIVKQIKFDTIEMAVADLAKTYPDKYDGKAYLQLIEQVKSELNDTENVTNEVIARAANLERTVLLSNPLLDFDKILLLKRDFGNNARSVMSAALGMATLNSHNHTSISNPTGGWDNEIAVLSDIAGQTKIETLYKPETKKMVSDIDLDFDGKKMMFTMPGTYDRWHIFEINADGKNLQQLTPKELPDVDHFDSCYMPDGRIVFCGTANFQGLPCENGSRPMASVYQLNRETNAIRQLTFEQDSDWCPTMMNNGRLLYLRWEYTDTPHYFTRILFTMNPDGTEQMGYYGSNSYFPNAFFYARPLPNDPTKVVGIVGGHHGISRSGRLMILDPSKGRREAEGVVQEIPHRGREVEPIIKDQLVNGVWPQFLQPYPLSDKYYLVSAKLSPDSLWGIYLVDTFDNMTLIKEIEGSALLEPLPLRATQKPPVVPDKVNLASKEATVFLQDIYLGPGLKDIPRGKVKSLRLFTYHYAHNKTGGHASVGVETSWDIKRVLGTVPVEKDGSAMFKIPANMPIAIQPLDAEGRALQLMRSWIVGMPGETLSCIGCHESSNTSPPRGMRLATRKSASEIEPWYGQPRPFGYMTEVQPVLDRYCVSCHNGSKRADNKIIPNFADKTINVNPVGGNHSFIAESYMALHPYVRRPGPESDYHLLKPMEYHADTSELIRLLKNGHHNVKLDKESWDRLYTWIDLNAPYRGQWNPPVWREFDQDKRRMELAKLYACIEVDAEKEYAQMVEYVESKKIQAIKPEPIKQIKIETPKIDGWPFDADTAKQLQRKAGSETQRRLTLADGIEIELVLIPAGKYVTGDGKIIEIEKAFWMSTTEISNELYNLFDSRHDSRFIDQQWKDHTTPGYAHNKPQQPVIRISYNEATAFCDWISSKTNQKVMLPSQQQWQWACRAGSDKAFWFGDVDSDYSKYDNVADAMIQKFAVSGVNPQPISNPNRFYDFIPRDMRFNDGNMISANVGSYQSNPWGLKDMHGNVAEWTNSDYDKNGKKTVCGGSWRDRPKYCKADSKLGYESYQKIFNVGFRIIIEAE
ncbi:MAG: SUMF1/EgtB/PvdO family nonheme iron enzyme [Phycisphaerae bacterium]|nr:SUMF1/EgtB/PvdO family nonheme iron enzyme [Phycisphaerae bacterium]